MFPAVSRNKDQLPVSILCSPVEARRLVLAQGCRARYEIYETGRSLIGDIYVSDVDCDGPNGAGMAITAGDCILEINGHPTHHISLERARFLLESAIRKGPVSLLKSSSTSDASFSTKSSCVGTNDVSVVQDHHIRAPDKRHAVLQIYVAGDSQNGPLGVMVSHKKDPQFGSSRFFISHIIEKSPAYRDGRLLRGDELVMLNGHVVIFSKMDHVTSILHTPSNIHRVVVLRQICDDENPKGKKSQSPRCASVQIQKNLWSCLDSLEHHCQSVYSAQEPGCMNLVTVNYVKDSSKNPGFSCVYDKEKMGLLVTTVNMALSRSTSLGLRVGDIILSVNNYWLNQVSPRAARLLPRRLPQGTYLLGVIRSGTEAVTSTTSTGLTQDNAVYVGMLEPAVPLKPKRRNSSDSQISVIDEGDDVSIQCPVSHISSADHREPTKAVHWSDDSSIPSQHQDLVDALGWVRDDVIIDTLTLHRDNNEPVGFGFSFSTLEVHGRTLSKVVITAIQPGGCVSRVSGVWGPLQLGDVMFLFDQVDVTRISGATLSGMVLGFRSPCRLVIIRNNSAGTSRAPPSPKATLATYQQQVPILELDPYSVPDHNADAYAYGCLDVILPDDHSSRVLVPMLGDDLDLSDVDAFSGETSIGGIDEYLDSPVRRATDGTSSIATRAFLPSPDDVPRDFQVRVIDIYKSDPASMGVSLEKADIATTGFFKVRQFRPDSCLRDKRLLLIGDILFSLNQVCLKGMTHSHVLQLLKHAQGSVAIAVLRPRPAAGPLRSALAQVLSSISDPSASSHSHTCMTGSSHQDSLPFLSLEHKEEGPLLGLGEASTLKLAGDSLLVGQGAQPSVEISFNLQADSPITQNGDYRGDTSLLDRYTESRSEYQPAVGAPGPSVGVHGETFASRRPSWPEFSGDHSEVAEASHRAQPDQKDSAFNLPVPSGQSCPAGQLRLSLGCDSLADKHHSGHYRRTDNSETSLSFVEYVSVYSVPGALTSSCESPTLFPSVTTDLHELTSNPRGCLPGAGLEAAASILVGCSEDHDLHDPSRFLQSSPGSGESGTNKPKMVSKNHHALADEQQKTGPNIVRKGILSKISRFFSKTFPLSSSSPSHIQRQDYIEQTLSSVGWPAAAVTTSEGCSGIPPSGGWQSLSNDKSSQLHPQPCNDTPAMLEGSLDGSHLRVEQLEQLYKDSPRPLPPIYQQSASPAPPANVEDMYAKIRVSPRQDGADCPAGLSMQTSDATGNVEGVRTPPSSTISVVLQKSGLPDFGLTLTGGIDTPYWHVFVGGLVPSSPAMACGVLHQGQRLISINGVHIAGKTADFATQLLHKALDDVLLVLEWMPDQNSCTMVMETPYLPIDQVSPLEQTTHTLNPPSDQLGTEACSHLGLICDSWESTMHSPTHGVRPGFHSESSYEPASGGGSAGAPLQFYHHRNTGPPPELSAPTPLKLTGLSLLLGHHYENINPSTSPPTPPPRLSTPTLSPQLPPLVPNPLESPESSTTSPTPITHGLFPACQSRDYDNTSLTHSDPRPEPYPGMQWTSCKDIPAGDQPLELTLAKQGSRALGLRLNSGMGKELQRGLTVTEILADSVADHDGRLLPGDIITHVNGIALTGMPTAAVFNMFKGEWSVITLRVVRDSPPLDDLLNFQNAGLA